MTEQPAVCGLSSKRNGTLYVGVACDLPARIWTNSVAFLLRAIEKSTSLVKSIFKMKRAVSINYILSQRQAS